MAYPYVDKKILVILKGTRSLLVCFDGTCAPSELDPF